MYGQEEAARAIAFAKERSLSYLKINGELIFPVKGTKEYKAYKEKEKWEKERKNEEKKEEKEYLREMEILKMKEEIYNLELSGTKHRLR